MTILLNVCSVYVKYYCARLVNGKIFYIQHNKTVQCNTVQYSTIKAFIHLQFTNNGSICISHMWLTGESKHEARWQPGSIHSWHRAWRQSGHNASNSG